MKIKLLFIALLLLGSSHLLLAHPMPNTMVILNIHEKHISGQIQLPLGELQSAIGLGVNDNSDRLIERLGDTLRAYLLKHIRPKSFEGKPWAVTLGNMSVSVTKTLLTGEYKELDVAFTMTPPLHYDLRNFYFDYDVILHQVASHRILVNIKQDWQQGIVTEDSTLQQIGIIALDVPTGKIPPFQVSIGQGSTWEGFKSMVRLGMKHIADGTDHLLFLITLLLPAMLLAQNHRWTKTIGIKASLSNLLRIVTAFTIGHSATLLLAATQVVHPPTQPIEVLIAVSILVSAIHAYRPLFAGREVFVAGGFGLIHGMAFAESLTTLQLNTQQLLISVLGFNIGIELMQLAVVVAVIPVLLWLSRTRFYGYFRVLGAVIATLLAIFWVFQRLGIV